MQVEIRTLEWGVQKKQCGHEDGKKEIIELDESWLTEHEGMYLSMRCNVFF